MTFGAHASLMTTSLDSWEPDKNVEGCKRLLKSFWEHVGTDDNDYFPGHEVSAEQEWIGPLPDEVVTCCV